MLLVLLVLLTFFAYLSLLFPTGGRVRERFSAIAVSRGHSRRWGWFGVAMHNVGGVSAAVAFIWVFSQTERSASNRPVDFDEALEDAFAHLLLRFVVAFAVAAVVALVVAGVGDLVVRTLPRRKVSEDAGSEPRPVPVVRHDPCRQCGNVILVGVDRCPFCGMDRPH